MKLRILLLLTQCICFKTNYGEEINLRKVKADFFRDAFFSDPEHMKTNSPRKIHIGASIRIIKVSTAHVSTLQPSKIVGQQRQQQSKRLWYWVQAQCQGSFPKSSQTFHRYLIQSVAFVKILTRTNIRIYLFQNFYSNEYPNIFASFFWTQTNIRIYSYKCFVQMKIRVYSFQKNWNVGINFRVRNIHIFEHICISKNNIN